MRVEPSGPVPCRLAIFGEAPGWEEQQQGEGFVGKSGEELWAGLLRYTGTTRRDWYVSNVDKNGKPKNQKPKPYEISLALPELLEELERVRPRVVVAAGGTATGVFLGLPLSDVHGIPHRVEIAGVVYTVLPTYHPAAGLHNKGFLAAFAWDLQQLGRLINGEGHEGRKGSPRAPVNRKEKGAREALPGPGDVRVRAEAPSHLEGRSSWLRSPSLGLQGRATGRQRASGSELVIPRGAVVALDTEGWVENPWGLSLSLDGVSAWVIPVAHPSLPFDRSPWLTDRLKGCTVVMHNGIHDIPVLRALGVEVGEYHDTQVLAYHDILRTGSGSLESEAQNLGTLAYRELHVKLGELSDIAGVDFATKTIPYSEEVLAYAGADAIATWRLFHVYKQRGLLDYQPYQIDMGQVALVESMIANGIPFDQEGALDYYVDVLTKLEEHDTLLKDRAARLGKREFNPGSHPQVREIVTKKLGLRVRKRTKGGLASTNAKALADHVSDPFVALLQRRRELDKLRGTYLVPLLKELQ